jgi:hypothetical protein
MWNYCTLFDSIYLSRGMVMYESLKTHSGEFHLYIFAFDDLSRKILKELDLQNVTVIPLNEFETPQLLEIKGGRSKAEYCWTCTPSIINHVLKNYSVSVCTYLDSDLVFYSDPSVLIEEMIDHQKNVLITEHRFSTLARLYEEKRGGRFCVQFVTFTNEKNSLEILEKWRLQCINWCYARYEDGKFGDQKYLDDWPLTYSNIHILQHPGGGIAPWNLQQYRFFEDGNSITASNKKTGSIFKVVFFHFQYVKFIIKGAYDIGWYLIPAYVKKLFYITYFKKIENIEKRLELTNLNYQTVFSGFNTDSIKNFVKTGFKKVFSYNIIKTKR